MKVMSLRMSVAVMGTVCISSQALAEYPACRYHYRNVFVHSLFGVTWGTQGKMKMTPHEVSTFLDTHKNKDNIDESMGVPHILRSRRGKRSGGNDAPPEPVAETPAEAMKREAIEKGEVPTMTYRESGQWIMGLVPCQDVWIYDVVWHDEPAQRVVSIENTFSETVFIDTSNDPCVLNVSKRLYGVGQGKSRIIACPRRGRLGIWREQKGEETVDRLLTVVDVPREASKVVVRMGNRGALKADVD